MVNDTTGWIGVGKIQDPGAIYFTEDGGENWQLQQYLMSAVLDIQLFDCNNGWAVGGDYIYHSSNASIITSAKERTPTGHDITVTPNPGSGVFYVEGENIPLNGEPCQLILRNSTGTHKRTWHTSHLNHYKIDISGKPAGVYFLTVQFPSNNQMHSFTQKIIKL